MGAGDGGECHCPSCELSPAGGVVGGYAGIAEDGGWPPGGAGAFWDVLATLVGRITTACSATVVLAAAAIFVLLLCLR